MAYNAVEHIVESMRGWKRPLNSYRRRFGSKYGLNRRISYLRREYGDENVVVRPMKGDKGTVEVYVRVK